MPFLVSDKGGQGNSYHDHFGDFIVTPRFLLSENRDLTQILSLAVRTPTGKTVNGEGLSTLSPHHEFWYGGFPRGWAIRGSAGVTVPTTREQAQATYDYSLAVGKSLIPYSRALFSDFIAYLAMNAYTTLDGPGPRYTYLSLTPGVRFHLGRDWFFLGGVDAPVAVPKIQGFSWWPILVIAKRY